MTVKAHPFVRLCAHQCAHRGSFGQSLPVSLVPSAGTVVDLTSEDDPQKYSREPGGQNSLPSHPIHGHGEVTGGQ